MRVLFLLPFPPRHHAPHGGGRAIAHLVAGVAARHHVAVAYLRAPDEPPIDHALAARCVHVLDAPRGAPPVTPAARWRRRLRLLRGLARARPMWATDFWVPSLADRVGALARTWRPDVIQVEFEVMTPYLDALAGLPAARVLTVHDPGASAARERARTATPLDLPGRLLDAWAWDRFARAALRRVGAAVAFTERDRAALAALAPGLRLERIPLGADLPPRPFDPVGSDPPDVVFVGSFAHPPNRDAARRLVRHIWPRVTAHRTGPGTLTLVGAEPPADLVRAAALPGSDVAVTGRVPDVAPYLERAAVVAVPLRQGGGMRVKVLEALAAGKALVATPLAAEGLDVRDGDALLLRETDDALAEAIGGLLADPARRAALATRARAWAETHLDWGRTIAAYDVLYHSLVPAPPR